MGQDHETLSFLQNQDLILLQETWNMKSVPIPGYIGYHILAETFSNFGHPRGGLSMYAMAKYDWLIEELDAGENWLQALKLTGKLYPNKLSWQLIIINVYIHPEKKPQKEKFLTLVNLIKVLQKTHEHRNLIISGDFNSNLITSKQTRRKRKDVLGNQLITLELEVLGLTTLNGNLIGDRPVAIMHLSGKSQSIIDFSISSNNLIPMIDSFQICPRPESDNFPQIMKINIILTQARKLKSLVQYPEKNNLRKLKWRGSDTKIMDTVQDHVNQTGTQKEETLKNWELSGQVRIRKLPVIPGCQKKTETKKEPWFNIQL